MPMMLRLAIAAVFIAGAAHAAGNVAHGKVVFQRCAMCHTIKKGGANGVGPDLFGVVGRKAATMPNFYYSPALKKSGIVWTPDKLDAWIKSPATLVPGNRMAFVGIPDAHERADLIAYLGTLK